MHTVAVIGASGIGLRTATNLQKEGWDVKVIEQHPSIGLPEQCSGLYSATGVERLQLPIEECLNNTIYGARIYSPNNTMLEIKRKKPVAYVTNREKYDKILARQAKKAGVEIALNTQLMSVRNDTLFLKEKGRGGLDKAKIIVGADGVKSHVRSLMGIEVPDTHYINSIQCRAKGSFDDTVVELYFGGFAKNFFAWVIPESKTQAKIGLGIPLGMNIKESYEQFVKEKEIEAKPFEWQGGLIPVMKPLQNIVKNNMVLVGDAAAQTKATTGGGIIIGSMAADVLSKSITAHLKDGKPLKDYEKNLKPINKELAMHYKIHKFIGNMKDEQLNVLMKKLVESGVGEYLADKGDMDLPSKFIPQLLRSPKYLSLLPDAMKFMMT